MSEATTCSDETVSVFERVRSDFEDWSDFLSEEIDFSLPDSKIHTVEHSTRVLYYALCIAAMRCLHREDIDTLAIASCFHDSRRLDDGFDTGHGARAAAYYEEACEDGCIFFDERASLIMQWHDRDDEDGIAAIAKATDDDYDTEELYKIFKDADALDRFRFGPNAVDVSYLRTEESLEFLETARALSTPK